MRLMYSICTKVKIKWLIVHASMCQKSKPYEHACMYLCCMFSHMPHMNYRKREEKSCCSYEFHVKELYRERTSQWND